MKKIIITIISSVFVLSAFLAFSLFVNAEDPTVVESGFCGAEGDGTNLSWTLDSEGTLTICGSGAMKDYDPGSNHIEQPWISIKDSIKKIVIQSGVTSIGDETFKLCTNLEEVIIPSSVERIGDSSFWGDSSLAEIDLPEGLKTIEIYAFHGCRILESVTIPASVTKIHGGSFGNCPNLSSIRVRSGNSVLYSVSNCVIEKASKKLVVGLNNSVIPTDGSVEIIGQMAFHDRELDEINIPDTVTTIETDAFWGCGTKNLKSITLPDSVTTIDSSAFAQLLWLEEVKLPKKLTMLSNWLFQNCRSLKTVTIPDNVTKIEYNAFGGCGKLKSINIPAKVTNIGSNVFAGSGLEYVFYASSRGDWDMIKIHEDNDVLFGATIHYNATDHVPDKPETSYIERPTCTLPGTAVQVVHCKFCDYEFSREEVGVSALNHPTRITFPATEATYDEHGYTEGVYCQDCETWISGHEIVHNTLGEREIVREATATEEGEVIITCTVCGERGLYSYSYKPDPEPTIGERIRKAVRGIIDWFLRLIAWLGGGH